MFINVNLEKGGSEPQGRQGFTPNESMFEPQATLTPCHPELVSGSYYRNITTSPENINNIPFAFHAAQCQVSGDYVPPPCKNKKIGYNGGKGG